MCREKGESILQSNRNISLSPSWTKETLRKTREGNRQGGREDIRFGGWRGQEPAHITNRRGVKRGNAWNPEKGRDKRFPKERPSQMLMQLGEWALGGPP